MANLFRYRLRRDTSTNWALSNPILFNGEPAVESDTNKLKIGDGVTAYNSLPYISGTGSGGCCEPLTNGDIDNPELIFADGDVVMGG